MDLPRGRVEEVGAAHDVGHALRRIVDHHGQLVGEQPVGAIEHEVADLARERLPLRSLQAVDECDLRFRNPHPERPRRPAGGQPGTTGARVEARAVDREAERGIGDLAARAAAPIGMRAQLLQRLAVERLAAALVEHFAVPAEAQRGQRAQDVVGRARLHARPVEILHAQEPAPAGGARVEPARQRRHQRAEVQRPGGRGREPADDHEV